MVSTGIGRHRLGGDIEDIGYRLSVLNFRRLTFNVFGTLKIRYKIQPIYRLVEISAHDYRFKISDG